MFIPKSIFLICKIWVICFLSSGFYELSHEYCQPSHTIMQYALLGTQIRVGSKISSVHYLYFLFSGRIMQWSCFYFLPGLKFLYILLTILRFTNRTSFLFEWFQVNRNSDKVLLGILPKWLSDRNASRFMLFYVWKPF